MDTMDTDSLALAASAEQVPAPPQPTQACSSGPSAQSTSPAPAIPKLKIARSLLTQRPEQAAIEALVRRLIDSRSGIATRVQGSFTALFDQVRSTCSAFLL